jgi:hypothetical protein
MHASAKLLHSMPDFRGVIGVLVDRQTEIQRNGPQDLSTHSFPSSSRFAPFHRSGMDPFSDCFYEFAVLQELVKAGMLITFPTCLAVHYFPERRIDLGLIWSRMRPGSSPLEIVHHIGIQKHCHSHLAVSGGGLFAVCHPPSPTEDMPTRLESKLLWNSFFQLLPVVILTNRENSLHTFPI